MLQKATRAGATILFILLLQDSGPARAQSCDEPAIELTGFDIGWIGTGHDWPTGVGHPFELKFVKRCEDTGELCRRRANCPGSVCRRACGLGPTGDGCEITQRDTNRACLGDSSVACDTNDDCSGSSGCVDMLGVHQPFVADGTPVCISMHLDKDASGYIDPQTGQAEIRLTVYAQHRLGINIETPCPRCGELPRNGEIAAIGDVATCSGGQRDGMPCRVQAVHPSLGGVSRDCPPDNMFSVGGRGARFPIHLTTGSVSRAATRPCSSPNDFHPENGNALCLDDFQPCESNADCAGGGDCGFYCHCGFCDSGDGAREDEPCMSDQDCRNGAACVSTGSDINLSQRQPNACESFVCGQSEPERCCADGDPGCEFPTALIGECDVVPAVCSTNQDCLAGRNGTVCRLRKRPCFAATIEREGAAITGGRVCEEDPTASCESATDCGTGACVRSCPTMRLTSVSCTPGTAATSINAAGGIPGPFVAEFIGTLSETASVCGDGIVSGTEECDDGNLDEGDTCDSDCIARPGCGDGMIDDGEECDDGNRESGDCCSSNCRFESAVVSCETGLECAPDGACDGAGGCEPDRSHIECDGIPCTADYCGPNDECLSVEPFAPLMCRNADAHMIRIVDRAGEYADVLQWRWKSLETGDFPDFGDPTNDTEYFACYFDDQISSARLLGGFFIPGTPAEWNRPGPRRFRLESQGGDLLVVLKRGVEGRAKIRLKFRGDGLDLPGPFSSADYFSLGPNFLMQFADPLGGCWESRSTPDTIIRNTPRRFSARRLLP